MDNSKKTNQEKENSRDIINLLSSEQLDNFIKNLSNPRFLGSTHMHKKPDRQISNVENLLKGELELRVNKSLKNSFLNPVTKVLILITIIFNILWFSLIYLL